MLNFRENSVPNILIITNHSDGRPSIVLLLPLQTLRAQVAAWALGPGGFGAGRAAGRRPRLNGDVAAGGVVGDAELAHGGDGGFDSLWGWQGGDVDD